MKLNKNLKGRLSTKRGCEIFSRSKEVWSNGMLILFYYQYRVFYYKA